MGILASCRSAIGRIPTDVNRSNIRGYARQAGCEINREIQSRVYSRTSERTPIAAEEWDTLLILDACRYDMFANVADEIEIDGDLSARVSLGSTSGEFLERNFSDRQYHDMVYVSANPHTADLDPETFHAHIEVYQDGWDEATQTVTPEAMTDAVRRAHAEYPNKRIVGHYMQPHYPFIGPLGQQISHRGYSPDADWRAMKERSIWTQLQFGYADVSLDHVRAAYNENLQLVLDSVRALSGDISGKTVLTADHGNLLGERQWPIPVRVFGHPRGLSAPELIDVPWFELPYETRRNITSDPPAQATEPDRSATDEQVNDRLRALGYAE